MALTPEQLADLERLRKIFVPLAEQARRDSQRQDNMDKMNPQNKGDGGLAKFLEPSKVKNRAYHGTQSDFNKFKSGPRNRLVKGMWFAQAPDSANFWAGQSEGANVMPVHLQFKNPAKREDYDRMLDELPYEKKKTSSQRASQLKKRGFDSLIMNEGTGDETYIALHPNQIKSAIGNRGTYDINEHDITKAHGGITHAHHLEIEERPL
jgi:hypothetical protein